MTIGTNVRDTVCLTSDNGCMSDFLFRLVTYQEQLKGLAGAGLVGLAPSSQFDGAQMFVPSLFEQGAIEKNMFSMFIDQNEKSKI